EAIEQRQGVFVRRLGTRVQACLSTRYAATQFGLPREGPGRPLHERGGGGLGDGKRLVECCQEGARIARLRDSPKHLAECLVNGLLEVACAGCAARPRRDATAPATHRRSVNLRGEDRVSGEV